MYIIKNNLLFTYINYTPIYKGVYVVEFGKETRSSSISQTKPCFRKSFIIHFVLEGQGHYLCDGKTYHLKPGQAFLISPSNLVQYCADEGTSWTYSWIALNGTDCDTLFHQCGFYGKAVIDYTPSDIAALSSLIDEERMNKQERNPNTFPLRVMEMCYDVLNKCAEKLQTEHLPSPKSSESVVDGAIAYMQTNMHRQIDITRICNELHISRTYFSAIFKSTLKQSPAKFLQNLRIQHASELLLQERYIPISGIAERVGFSNSAMFCKIFRKSVGLTPSQYRKENLPKK